MPQLLPSVGRWSILVAGAALVAACSDSSTTPSRSLTPSVSNADESPWPEFNGPSANAHIMHTKPWFAANGNGGAGNGRGGGGGGSTSNGISYHGGPVLQAETKVVAVYWGTGGAPGGAIFNGGPTPGTKGTGDQDGSLVGFFLRNLGPSSYFNINTTYTNGSGVHIANKVTYVGFWANASTPPASPTDADMLAMLQSGFGTAITYDSQTLYLIMTPSGVNLGGGFGTQYCAYHYHGSTSAGTVLYAAMPYNQQYPGICTNGTAAPNGDAGADAEVNTLAHEIEETTTDLMGNAWFDVRGYENADKCAWTWGSTSNNGTGVYNITLGNSTVGFKQFLVQQNWVNASGGYCAKSF